MIYEDDEPIPMRRLPLLAHGSVSRPLILFLLASVAVLVYGGFLLTSPSAQDERICATWLQQYTERINCKTVFQKAGCTYRGTAATTHGVYSVVNIYVKGDCKELPRPIDNYFSHNKLGMVMEVRVFPEGGTNPFLTRLY